MDIQHRDIIDAELHEPKGTTTGTNSDVYQADGQGSGDWQPLIIGNDTIVDSTFQYNGGITQGLSMFALYTPRTTYFTTTSTTFVTIQEVHIYIPTPVDKIRIIAMISSSDNTNQVSVRIRESNSLATSTSLQTTSSTSFTIVGGGIADEIFVTSLSGWKKFIVEMKTVGGTTGTLYSMMGSYAD